MTAPDAAPVDTTTPVDPSTPQPTPTAMPPQLSDLEPDAPAADSLELPENLDAARRLRTENKRLRERSLAAEGELETLRRQAIERIAAAELRDVRDFTDRHPDVNEFLNDDGQFDADAVLAAAQALASDRPHFAVGRPAAPPTQRPLESLRPGASPVFPPDPGPNWSDTLRRGITLPTDFAD